MNRMLRITSALALLLAGPALAESPERLRLQSAEVELEATSALGGRVLHFSAKGLPNLIKVGDAVAAHPSPEVSPEADDIGYLGHDVWLGPQSGWWSDQSVNPARRAENAPWPPDPYLAFAATAVAEHSPQRLVLDGIDSPVTGVRLRKTFALDPRDPASIEVRVSALNVRDRPVSRDLWFNTRASAAMSVFVPVASARDARMEAGSGMDAPVWQVEDGMFSLLPVAVTDERPQRRGKVFLQPSAGWMAGFADGQAFIIRFEQHPRESIHPEHGQVELYLDHGEDIAAGLLELEVHAPFRALAAGEAMEAVEHWTALPYDGPDEPASQLAFLCRVAAPRLGDPALCVAGAE